MHLLSAHKRLHQLVVAFFASLAHHAIRHPRQVLVITALVTLAAIPGLWRLTLRTDGHALVSDNAPEVIYDKAIRDRFGIEDPMVVLIRAGPEGIFNSNTVQLVRKLTDQFRALPAINPSNVMSLATEPSFRLYPGTLLHQNLLAPPLKSPAELEQLRDDLRRIRLYTGTLVSLDGQSTAILIGAPPGSDRTRLYQRVLDLVASVQPRPEDITVTGAPVAESLLGLHILEDLGVPRALLGTRTVPHQAQLPEWRIPRSLFELRQLVARRIGLVPVAVVVMTLVFFVSFRNVLASLLPLPEVAVTLVFVFGLMGWLGVPIYLTIGVMPVLLTAMCVTDEIHVFSHYFALLRQRPGGDHVEVLKQTVDDMVCPVANTTLTTAIGFVSFAFSPLGPVQAFGIFTSIGVLFSLFYSLTVLPAMLTLINPARLLSRRRPLPAERPSLAAWFARWAAAVVRHRYWVIGLVLAVVALTPFGLRRLVIQDSWIDGFDPDSEFRRATQLVNDHFYGMHLLLVSLEAPRLLEGEVPASAVTPDSIVLPGDTLDTPTLIAGGPIRLSIPKSLSTSGSTGVSPSLPWQSHLEMAARNGDRIVARIAPKPAPTNWWQELARAGRVRFEIVARSHVAPEMIRTIADLAAFIRERRQYAVGGVLSPADYLETTRFMARPNDPNARRLPADATEIKLMWDYYGLARGQQKLRQIVDTNYWQSLTTVFLKNANFVDTAKLMSELRAYERQRLTPKGIRLNFAGDVAVSQSLIQSIVTTQLQSLFFSLVGIYLVTSLLGRSLRWGIYCVLPSTLAVVLNFAVMGWFHIPLGVATSMFAGMTLGIGVDFAIHLLEGYERARTGGHSRSEALSGAMSATGPAVLINTLAISLGFGVLTFSQVPANARLGLLTVLGLVNCLIASLLLLPVLLHRWPLREQRSPSP